MNTVFNGIFLFAATFQAILAQDDQFYEIERPQIEEHHQLPPTTDIDAPLRQEIKKLMDSLHSQFLNRTTNETVIAQQHNFTQWFHSRLHSGHRTGHRPRTENGTIPWMGSISKGRFVRDSSNDTRNQHQFHGHYIVVGKRQVGALFLDIHGRHNKTHAHRVAQRSAAPSSNETQSSTQNHHYHGPLRFLSIGKRQVFYQLSIMRNKSKVVPRHVPKPKEGRLGKPWFVNNTSQSNINTSHP